MERFIVCMALITLLAVLALMTVPASAITNGTPDTEHPNVGTIVVDLEMDDGVGRFTFCSGSLLSATHFLTAGHCTESVDFLSDQGILVATWVTFDQDLHLIDADTGEVDPEHVFPVNRWQSHPALRCTFAFCRDDLGVLTLASPVSGIAPIVLPTEGFLDQQAAQGGLLGHVFVNVGYGIEGLDRSFLSPNAIIIIDGVRDTSTSPFLALTNVGLYLNANSNATSQGGHCFGDSGSPKFFEQVPGPAANLAVAVTTWADATCEALNGGERLDTRAARSFLGQFVPLP